MGVPMKRFFIAVFLFFCTGSPLFPAEQDFASKVIHIGMIVSNLEESLSFYKDVIGFVQTDQTSFDVDADFGARSGLTDRLEFHVEVLKLGSGDDATQLKLMTFGAHSQKQANDFIHDRTGVQYLTINVADLSPIIARIKAKNLKMLGETPTPLNGDTQFVLVKDPDGTFIELIGPMK